MSEVELIAALLGVAYIYLVSHENPWCWPCALISTGLYTYLFWDVELVFSMLLNAYYLVMAIYGYWCWTKGKQAQPKSIVQVSLPWHGGYILIGCALSAVMIILQGTAWLSWPALDAYMSVFAVMTTWLVAHKYLANWGYWAVINSAAVVLYAHYELWYTVGLYAIYLGFSFYGLLQWRQRLST